MYIGDVLMTVQIELLLTSTEVTLSLRAVFIESDRRGREGLGLVLVVVKRLGPKALTFSLRSTTSANPKPEQPHPTNQKETTNQKQMILTFSG